jgi:hypothetical protein
MHPLDLVTDLKLEMLWVFPISETKLRSADVGAAASGNRRLAPLAMTQRQPRPVTVAQLGERSSGPITGRWALGLRQPERGPGRSSGHLAGGRRDVGTELGRTAPSPFSHY